MTLFDLDFLRKDQKQDGLYNLFEPTFKLQSGYEQSFLIADRDSMMRIDLVCNEIYNRVDLVDFLMNLNDIDNPLNIMEGDKIFFTSYGAIENFRLKEIDVTDTRAVLLNANKSTKKDPNRQKFIEENYALPPTLLPEPKEPVRIVGDRLVIGK